ncbi:RNA-binding S4 domain-containing protein [Rhizomicrobium electricum]|uniref:RNA-binding S4 domain-containing protein n=1 Tax=Rhizomicrobium electricum TaxID=480070 RepID=A0ABN1EZ96_9PROT|nr:RNA-binding S4 domain-containing protein [Rhizomicrobium electricum]NIJ50084.1 ribosome-associated heat shock protein Hsp15 [Rhizomicrobium electricum]
MAEPERLRLDKWLWCARFYKTRGLAAEACEKGHLRINGFRVEKAGREVRPGDVLTIPQGREVVVVRVLAGAKRRGPATEARTLYEVVEE